MKKSVFLLVVMLICFVVSAVNVEPDYYIGLESKIDAGSGVDGEGTNINGLVVDVRLEEFYSIPADNNSPLPSTIADMEKIPEAEIIADITGLQTGADAIYIYLIAKANPENDDASASIKFSVSSWANAVEGAPAGPEITLANKASGIVEGKSLACIEDGEGGYKISTDYEVTKEWQVMARSLVTWIQNPDLLAGTYNASITISITAG